MCSAGFGNEFHSSSRKKNSGRLGVGIRANGGLRGSRIPSRLSTRGSTCLLDKTKGRRAPFVTPRSPSRLHRLAPTLGSAPRSNRFCNEYNSCTPELPELDLGVDTSTS